jgi:hypothetical protein
MIPGQDRLELAPCINGPAGFCREIQLQNAPAQPRRGGKTIAGGLRSRIGHYIYGAPARAKVIGSQNYSVALPGLGAAFHPNPGLAPGAIILPPLRGRAGERREFRDRNQLLSQLKLPRADRRQAIGSSAEN